MNHEKDPVTAGAMAPFADDVTGATGATGQLVEFEAGTKARDAAHQRDRSHIYTQAFNHMLSQSKDIDKATSAAIGAVAAFDKAME